MDYENNEITAIYMKFYRSGPLGEIRRTIIRECLKVIHEMLLSYNPHPGRRSVIAQFIIPKVHETMIRDLFLVYEDIEGLSGDYNPLYLSPHSKKKGLGMEKVLIEHLISTIRSWKATAMIHESQGVFDMLTSQSTLAEKELEGKSKTSRANSADTTEVGSNQASTENV